MIKDEVRNALNSERGAKALLELMTTLEQHDIPVAKINLEVRVRATQERATFEGTFFNTINLSVGVDRA